MKMMKVLIRIEVLFYLCHYFSNQSLIVKHRRNHRRSLILREHYFPFISLLTWKKHFTVAITNTDKDVHQHRSFANSFLSSIVGGRIRCRIFRTHCRVFVNTALRCGICKNDKILLRSPLHVTLIMPCHCKILIFSTYLHYLINSM